MKKPMTSLRKFIANPQEPIKKVREKGENYVQDKVGKTYQQDSPHSFFWVILLVGILAFTVAAPGKDVLRDLSPYHLASWIALVFLMLWSLTLGIGINLVKIRFKRDKELKISLFSLFFSMAPFLTFILGLILAENYGFAWVPLIPGGITLWLLLLYREDPSPVWTRKIIHRRLVKFSLLLWFVLLLVFIIDRVYVPWGLGPTGVILSAFAGYTAMGAYILPSSQRSGLPLMLIGAGLAIIFSLLGINFKPDLHPERGIRVSVPETRPSIPAYFDQWVEGIKDTSKEAMPTPIFIVASEGGGLRSAYWTGSILSRIAAEAPSFKDHLLAISSVSGGTFGSGIFLSELKENKPSFDTTNVKELLTTDYLSSLTAGLVYSNLTQLIIPAPIPFLNRAEYLHSSWEESLCSEQKAYWQAPLLNLYGQGRFPLFLINTDHTETGKRAVWSYAKFDSSLSDVEDLFSQKGLSDQYSLTECISSSARFPYVTPSARVYRRHPGKKSTIYGHLVDGGYYENVGLFTAIDLIQELAGRIDEKFHLHLIVLRAFPDKDGDPFTLANEFIEPVVALYNTRAGRYSHSKNILQQDVMPCIPNSSLHIFQLHEEDVPTSWYLSRKAQELVETEVKAYKTKIDSIINLINGK